MAVVNEGRGLINTKNYNKWKDSLIYVYKNQSCALSFSLRETIKSYCRAFTLWIYQSNAGLAFL